MGFAGLGVLGDADATRMGVHRRAPRPALSAVFAQPQTSGHASGENAVFVVDIEAKARVRPP